MKMFLCIIISLLLLAVWLNVGMYQYRGEHETDNIIFIKKYMTFQILFFNMAASAGGPWALHELSDEEKNQTIEYCKYRLGIITDLSTQDELESCWTL